VKICCFFNKAIWANFGDLCFPTLNLTTFAKVVEKFAKFSRSQNLKNETLIGMDP
jgi:hypothetical protein